MVGFPIFCTMIPSHPGNVKLNRDRAAVGGMLQLMSDFEPPHEFVEIVNLTS